MEFGVHHEVNQDGEAWLGWEPATQMSLLLFPGHLSSAPRAPPYHHGWGTEEEV